MYRMCITRLRRVGLVDLDECLDGSIPESPGLSAAVLSAPPPVRRRVRGPVTPSCLPVAAPSLPAGLFCYPPKKVQDKTRRLLARRLCGKLTACSPGGAA